METPNDPITPEGGLVPDPLPESDMPISESKPQGNEELRAYAERMKEERDQYRNEAWRAVLGDLGLKPDEGLGVALMDSYTGLVNVEKVSEFAAQKYKFQPETSTPPPEVVAGARVEQVMQAGSVVTPPPPDQAEVEAIAKMYDPEAGTAEAMESLTVKLAKLQESL